MSSFGSKFGRLPVPSVNANPARSEELAAKVRAENNSASKALSNDALNPQSTRHHDQDMQQLAPVHFNQSPAPPPRQSQVWPLPSQHEFQNTLQRGHSGSAAVRSGSVTNGTADSHGNSQWASLAHVSTGPISSQGNPRGGSDRLDALASAATNHHWQPSTVASGKQPPTNSGWADPGVLRSSQQSLDLEQKQALAVIARGIAEKSRINGKQRVLAQKIIETLGTAVTSMRDESTYDQPDNGDAQTANDVEEENEIQHRLEALLAQLVGNDSQKPRAGSTRQKTNGVGGGERCSVCDKPLPRNCELKSASFILHDGCLS